MSESDRMFIEAALRKLFKPTGFFSVSDFDEICELANVIPPAGVRAKLKVAHCISYRDMSKAMREEIAQMVMETLNSPGFEFQMWVDSEPQQAIAGGKVLRLLRGK